MDTPGMDREEIVEFRCAKCGIPLTDPLRELTDAEQLCDDDAEPAVPQGYFFIEDGYVLINVRDRLNVRRVKDEDRLGGCCGMDGMDGPNTECINGHEVATEVTDCWLPHSLRSNQTQWLDTPARRRFQQRLP